MKRVTASEARRNWFRLLDEVAAGAVVSIERGGRRIVLRAEPLRDQESDRPDYGSFLHAPEVDGADGWSWRWSGPDADLEPEGG
jgi:antitoxin (DNA-binding transcriptional repressor) of toxin-antitoxin stability system